MPQFAPQFGLSYSLSTLTLPALLTLPSADAAARTFRSLAGPAKTQLRALTAISSAAFALAFALSPRPYRHPYLLYTSLFALGSGIATLDAVAPYLHLHPTSATATTTSQQQKKKKEKGARAAHLEASYVELGAGSDGHSDGTSGEDDDTVAGSLNGEEVRVEVEGFKKEQWVQTAVAGLGFLMAVIGIWGDGAAMVFQSETFVIEV